MPTATITAADFTTDGTAPAEAYAVVERATPDVSGEVVVSTAPQVIRLTAGVGTFPFDADEPYKIRLHGVDGLEDAWYFQHDADVSAAELYRLHQIDPTSLEPLGTFTTYSEQLATFQAQLDAILSGAPGDLDDFFEAAARFGVDEATVTALQALVAGKAPLASPAFTGTPTAPTVAGSTDSSTKLANTAFVQAVAAALAASVSATYVALLASPPDHTVVKAYVDISVVPPALKGWDGTAWVALGGGGTTSSITITDLGNGIASVTVTGTDSITDLANGLASVSGATVTDLGNGLATAA